MCSSGKMKNPFEMMFVVRYRNRLGDMKTDFPSGSKPIIKYCLLKKDLHLPYWEEEIVS